MGLKHVQPHALAMLSLYYILLFSSFEGFLSLCFVKHEWSRVLLNAFSFEKILVFYMPVQRWVAVDLCLQSTIVICFRQLLCQHNCFFFFYTFLKKNLDLLNNFTIFVRIVKPLQFPFGSLFFFFCRFFVFLLNSSMWSWKWFTLLSFLRFLVSVLHIQFLWFWVSYRDFINSYKKYIIKINEAGSKVSLCL